MSVKMVCAVLFLVVVFCPCIVTADEELLDLRVLLDEPRKFVVGVRNCAVSALSIPYSGVENITLGLVVLGGAFLMDGSASRLMRRHANSFVAKVCNLVEPVCRSKYFIYSGAVIATTGVLLRRTKLYEMGILLAEAALLNRYLTRLMKWTFGRRRPWEADSAAEWRMLGGGGSSFPSGHTSTAFAAATAIALHLKSTTLKVLLFSWAILIGMQRIFTGAHWVSDVLAGSALGITVSTSLYAARNNTLYFAIMPTRTPDGKYGFMFGVSVRF